MRWKRGSTLSCVILRMVSLPAEPLPAESDAGKKTSHRWYAGSAIALGNLGECRMQVSETTCFHTWRPASQCSSQP